MELTKNDVALLVFIARYKMMLASNTKLIYNSNWYYLKKVKTLIDKGYIRRYQFFYLRLNVKGIHVIKKLGYDYTNNCRNYEYTDRLKIISDIATITIGTNIEFTASWELKEKGQYTKAGCKIIGELTYENIKRAAYYISKDKVTVYIKQVMNDIKKVAEQENVIIFADNFDFINKRTQYFKFGKRSILVILNTRENKQILMNSDNIDYFDIMARIYKTNDIVYSDYYKADYMINRQHYIVLMPFLDTEKLHRLKYYKRGINVDILTLQENQEKIYEILDNKINLVFLDKFVGGTSEKDIKQ